MGIRRGASAIQNQNEKISENSKNRSYIPELFLRDNADVAVIRMLTDDPVDYDVHKILDKSVSKYPFFRFCTSDDDDGSCEWCQKDEKSQRVFMFWVYLEKILHVNQDVDKTWNKISMGSKTMFEEIREQVVLFRKNFGRGQSNWNLWSDIKDLNGTWLDRQFHYKRNGVRGDIETTYTVQQLSESAMPDRIRDIIPKLPSLVAVARGEVTDLSELLVEEETERSAPKATEATEATEAPKKKKEISQEESPDTEFELPED